MLRFGYGRLYYISNNFHSYEHISRIANNDSDSCHDSELGQIQAENLRNVTIREGIWIDGKLNYYGRTIDFKGNVYVGEYKDGYKQGQGRYLWNNGDIYDGMWDKDQPDGWVSFIAISYLSPILVSGSMVRSKLKKNTYSTKWNIKSIFGVKEN